jgi:hypothetical protein
MTAVTHRVFDDLILSGFMRTIPHNVDFCGNFGYAVGKYADNGCAKTRNELKSYFAEYKDKASSLFGYG